MSGYEIAHVDDVPELAGTNPIRPVRHHFGITGFGVNAWVAASAGDRLIPEHREADEGGDPAERDEELYLVVRGRATFELDGERRDAPAGTLVFVRPGVNRTAFAEEAGTWILAVGGTPGKPFEAVGWELWHPVRDLYAAGAYDEAVERARGLLESYPDNGVLLYNLACCESLAGQPAPAIEHLGRAIESSERYRELARADTDFDPIRGEPGFSELVAG